MAKLSYQIANNLKVPGRYNDGAGLTLLVKATGRKSWVQRLSFDGKRRDLGLGSFPDVGIADARDRASKNRTLVAAGMAPVKGSGFAPTAPSPEPPAKTTRPARPVHLFEDVARAAHKHMVDTGRLTNPKNIVGWLHHAERHLFPVLGHVEIGAITSADLLDILEPINQTTPETCKKLIQILRKTFNRAKVRGIIESNPLDGVADELGPRGKPSTPMAALPYSEVAAALTCIEESTTTPVVKLAVRFMWLTAVRGAEVRGAQWSEIDLDAGLWEIPAERMKMKQGHTVPLSRQAMTVLDAARGLYGDAGLIFTSPTSLTGQLSNNTMGAALKRCGVDAVPHGSRATWRTWAAENFGPAYRDAAEQVLAHKTGSAMEQIYNRAEYMAQRRELLQAWGDFLD